LQQVQTEITLDSKFTRNFVILLSLALSNQTPSQKHSGAVKAAAYYRITCHFHCFSGFQLKTNCKDIAVEKINAGREAINQRAGGTWLLRDLFELSAKDNRLIAIIPGYLGTRLFYGDLSRRYTRLNWNSVSDNLRHKTDDEP
jgi:hypothetical protein